MSLDINLTCRGCLSKLGEEKVTHSLHSEELRELFFECSSIEMPIIDALPQQICSQCYRKLFKWSDFRKLCRRSDQTHQSLVAVDNEDTVAMDTDEEVDINGDDPPPQSDDGSSTIASDCDSQSEDLNADDNEKDKDFMDTVVASSNCPVCQEEFADSLDLRDHLKSHLAEKNPECPICEMKFTRKCKAYSHILSCYQTKIGVQSSPPQPRKRNRDSGVIIGGKKKSMAIPDGIKYCNVEIVRWKSV